MRIGPWEGKPTLRLGCSCLSEEEEEEKRAEERNFGSREEKVAASGASHVPKAPSQAGPNQPAPAFELWPLPLAHEPLNRGVLLPTRPTEAAFPGPESNVDVETLNFPPSPPPPTTVTPHDLQLQQTPSYPRQ